jgi:hypothetical protein
MPLRPSDLKPNVMRLKLACIRVAQEVLPHDAAAADVMRLGREFYRWISNDRPRPRRKLQRRLTAEAIEVIARPANGTPYKTFAIARLLMRDGAAIAEQEREKKRQRAARPARKLPVPVNSPEPSAPLDRVA